MATSSATNRTEHNQAQHNEDLCRDLHLRGGYEDWVITTAFYSALHYVRQHVFPLKETTENGSEVILASLDAYVSYHHLYGKDKHGIVRQFAFGVSKSCGNSYKALLDLSFTSRYNGDRVFAPFPAQAISLLEKIKIEVGKSGKK